MLNIVLSQNKLLVYQNHNNFLLPNIEQITLIKNSIDIFHQNETELFAVVNNYIELPQEFKLVSLRQALNDFSPDVLTKIVYYQQLQTYYNTHKFCGSCGKHTQRQLDNKFVHCNNCNTEIYPHIAPCVIVRIHRGSQILMARGVNFPPNSWGLVAGFVELGESLEQAVAREVLEEVGVKIKNLKFWQSQPWPFPSPSIMIGFTADYASGEIVIQESEIAEAGFFDKNNIPGLPSTEYSIASKMINEYLTG